MNHLKYFSKRGLALLLTLAMCLGMLQITAFAEEEHTHNEDGWTCTQGESTKTLTCEKHAHDDSCYTTKQGELKCTDEEHEHTSECYGESKPVQTCVKDEHTHGDSCYETKSELICIQGEHTHDGGCYDENDELICGQEEHSHGDGCYETRQTEELICGQEEHTHNDSCSEVKSELSCGKTEHKHNDGCYEVVTVKVCEVEDEHEHTDECYTITEGTWTCTPPEETDPAEKDPATVGQELLDAAAEVPAADEITEENWKDAQTKVNAAWDAYNVLYDLYYEYKEAGKPFTWLPAYREAYEKVKAADEAVKLFKEAAEEAEAAEKLANCPFEGVWSTDENGSKILTITGEGVYEGTFAEVDENGERVKLASTRNQEESFDLVLNVTEIKEALFASNSKIAKVTLNGVNEVGKNAFQRSGLTELVLDNVGYITNGAFSYCNSLTSVKLSNIGSFDHAVFYQSGLTEATISNCPEISYRAFRGCPALRTVNITDVGTVGWLAFQSCGSLTTVNMSGVNLIEGGAFEDCGSLANISIDENTKLGYLDANRNLIEVIPGIADRVAAILAGQFNLATAEDIEELTPDAGWDDSRVAKSANWDQYDYGTQLVEQARWTNPGTGASANTEAEVKVDAYYTAQKQMDFIFVLDLSNSMTKLGNLGDQNARFYDMQSKLLDVSYELLNTPGYDCRVAFTTFGHATTESRGFFSDSDAASDAIMSLTPYYENTNYGLGLRSAQALLSGQAGRDTTVIFISDGQPRDNTGASTSDLDGSSSAAAIKAAGASIYGVLQSVPSDEYAGAVAAMEKVCSEGLFFESSNTYGFSEAVNQAIAAAYNNHTVTIPVNPAFENVRGLRVSATAGSARYDATTHTITWTITGMPFMKHTLRYTMSLTAENAAQYGDQTYPVNSGSAFIDGGAVVEIPQLSRTVSTSGTGGGGGGGTPPTTNPDPTPDEPDVDVPNPDVPLVDVPDVDVPMTELPEEVDLPEEEVPMAETPEEVEILEEDVPLANVPRTGDISALWYLTTLLSAGILAFLGLRRKNRS